MRNPVLLALCMTACLVGTAAAVVPPLPADLKPREWKAPDELKETLDGFANVQNEEQAKEHLKKVEALLDKHPDWIDLHRHYIGVTRVIDMWPDVQPRYLDRAAKDSTNADWQYLAGLFERGPAAEARFRKALKLDPQNYYARCGLALVLMSSLPQNPDEAFPLLFEAVRMRPDHPYGYQALALAYEMAREWETGIQARKLDEIVEPSSFQPVNYEANDLKQAGRPDEATARIEAFVKDHPKKQDALRALVSVYQSANRAADAARVQVELAKLADESPDDAYNAATLVLTANNDKDGAFDWLSKAIDRGFDNDQQAIGDFHLNPLHAAREDSVRFAKLCARMREEHEKDAPKRKAKVLAQMVSKPAPDFAVKTLDGQDMSLSSLKGKVVILDFWATWCGPCRMTLPLVKKMQATLQGRPVQILCMNVWERDPDRAQVAPYWKDNAYPMTVGLASQADAKNYEVTGIPTLFVLDQEGRLRFKHVGYAPFMDEEVVWVVESLL